jgi:hypothetical protein
MDASTQSGEGDSLFGLIAGLREDVRNLFREEVRLAKTEVSEKTSRSVATRCGRKHAACAGFLKKSSQPAKILGCCRLTQAHGGCTPGQGRWSDNGLVLFAEHFWRLLFGVAG